MPYLRPLLRPFISKMPSPHSITPPKKQTILLKGSNELDLSRAAVLLRTNHLVAFPTETVYGLGANAFCSSAVCEIFLAKSRPQDNPLIVHVASPQDLLTYSLTPPLSPPAQALAAAFWPGPLTLVLPLAKDSGLAKEVTAGLNTVAVRVPKHPVASALLARCGVPVAAPSANLSGRPSPTCVKHVMRDLEGRVEAVVDGGELWGEGGGWGVESTVVEVMGDGGVRLLRPGVVGREQVERVIGGKVLIGGGGDGVVRAPGMKYRHYAPEARVEVVGMGNVEGRVGDLRKGGWKVGVLVGGKGWGKVFGDDVVVVECGGGDVEGFARGLYRGLRAFDGEEEGVGGVDVILAVPPRGEGGVEEAVMNRLLKAAAGGNVK